MKTQWTFHDSDRVKKHAQSYWSTKTEQLERMLSNYGRDLKRICLTLYRHAERDEWELRGVLHLPTAALTVEHTSPSVDEAIDNVADKLTLRIGHHKNDLRRKHLHRSRKHRRRQFASAGEFLARDAASSRSQAFAALLMPYADQLYDHARRELLALEQQGAIPRGEWVPSDLVDDLLVRACERYGDRFPDTSIDVWLFQQLNQQLDELRLAEPPLTFAASNSELVVEEDDSDLDDARFWLDRLLQPPQSLSLEEMVPDRHWSGFWDDLSADEQREKLTQLLQELPKHQRQALMLKDAYGFETFEIVRALGRCSEDVEADLAEAREKLRAGLSTYVA